MHYGSKLPLLLLLACKLADASDLLSLEGSWVTQPSVSSRSAASATNPNVLVFTRRGDELTGLMTTEFGPMELTHISKGANGQVFFTQVFNVGFGTSTSWSRGELNGGELHLYLTSGASIKERIARRATPAEVAAYEAVKSKPVTGLLGLPANESARTPPMGLKTSDKSGTAIDDRTVRELADAMVATGLRDVGFTYLVIDDGWQGARDSTGQLHPDSKFPDMKALAAYVHSRGLKLGLYSSPGPYTCGGHPGSYGHEDRDAQMYAHWGVDYLTYEWCSADEVYNTPAEMQAVYHKMGEAIRVTGHPIVYALSQGGLYDVGSWGAKVSGNLWRTSNEVPDRWESIANIGFGQDGHEINARPGHWNDPGMLQIGNGGMNMDEYRTQMTLWSMLSAPLMISSDLRRMSEETKSLLSNREVIAVNQDSLGRQSQRVRQEGATQVWSKRLSDRSSAVALFNLGPSPAEVRLQWSELGLRRVSGIRDLWTGQSIIPQRHGYTAVVPSHGSILLRVEESQHRANQSSLNIVFIGDSITQGKGKNAAPAFAYRYLARQPEFSGLNFENQGRGGCTTVNFLPSQDDTFQQVEDAAGRLQEVSPNARLLFSVMLGTNDSASSGPLGSPVSPDQYRNNLKAIIDRLLRDFPESKVIINHPIWYSPNTQNSSVYLQDGLNRLQSYFPEISKLARSYRLTHRNRVLVGDTAAFDYFKKNHLAYLVPEKGAKGTFYLHPNKEGAEVLGQFWGTAMQRLLKNR